MERRLDSDFPPLPEGVDAEQVVYYDAEEEEEAVDGWDDEMVEVEVEVDPDVNFAAAEAEEALLCSYNTSQLHSVRV